MILTSKHVAEEGRTWLGTPWRHQAMLKGIGVDCVGLLAGIAKNLNLFDASLLMRDPILRGYGREPDPRALALACETYLEQTDRRFLLGRIVFLRVPRGSYPQHFGLISREDPPCLIHATAAHPRAVTENRLDRAWAGRVFRVYKFRGVTECN